MRSEEFYKQLRLQIMRHEGSVIRGGLHVPYRDSVGVLTIGYGHNLEARPIQYIAGLTQKQAEAQLDCDLEWAIGVVEMTYPWSEHLNDARYGVLIDMMFNLGPTRLRTFKNFLSELELHANTGATHVIKRIAYEMLDSKWARQVPHRAITLVKVMLSGEWRH
jgi:lysozyme